MAGSTRNGLKTFTVAKDPDSVLDYQVDWSAWLGDDAITSSSWSVPEGLTQPIDASNTTTTTKIWLEGGIAHKAYQVVNHIVTTGGREEDAEIKVEISNRF